MKFKFLEIKINRKINKIIVASKYMKYWLEKNGFDPDNIEIIPYFTQPNIGLSPEKSKENVILFVGRLHWTKGLQYLLQALIYVKEPFKLLVCGEGPYEEKAKELVKDLNLSRKVKFIGWVDSHNLAKYYLMSSLIVIPSLWPEPFGIVGIEAMSYGKPVVAFDVGGISEWLKDRENGFLVNWGDSRALAEKISIVLQNKGLALEMGEQGKKLWATKFSKEIHLKKLIEIFKQCL
jgi:glycosyltransferase involved in cell wall biosynthesis